jgi:hypothetical protein
VIRTEFSATSLLYYFNAMLESNQRAQHTSSHLTLPNCGPIFLCVAALLLRCRMNFSDPRAFGHNTGKDGFDGFFG